MVDIQSAYDRIQQAIEYWNTISQRINEHPEVAEVSNVLEKVKSILDGVSEKAMADRLSWFVFMRKLDAMTQNFQQYAASQYVNPNHYQAWLDSSLSHAWEMYQALLAAIPMHASKKRREQAIKRLASDITFVNEYLEKAREAKNYMDRQYAELEERLSVLSERKEELDESRDRAVEAANEAEKASGLIKNNLERAEDLLQMLEGAHEKQGELFNDFEKKREQIENYLKNANKVGLAKAFQDKREQLTWIWIAWAIVFIVDVITIFLLGWNYIFPLVENGVDIKSMIARITLVSPLIWLAWFAAIQYSRVLRLSEDYAFKEAAAMAYVGYRDEMGDDKELVRLLQEYAIRTFGDNPSRLLAKQAERVSPVDGLFGRICETFKPRKDEQ